MIVCGAYTRVYYGASHSKLMTMDFDESLRSYGILDIDITRIASLPVQSGIIYFGWKHTVFALLLLLLLLLRFLLLLLHFRFDCENKY